MLQGTGSSVGKSLLVAGLCRALTRQGLRVRPFKPQNMSNNAAVTPDGGEIGRAQALQAMACGVPPSVHMNPVLLKPQSEVGAQIIVQGQVWGQARARDYQDLKPQLLPFILDSFSRLAGGLRHRDRRGRRQRLGSQSPPQRHRQYGLRPGGRRARGARRRYRPRRRHREPRRHPDGSGARGCRSDRRLHRQSDARRRLPFRRRHGLHRRTAPAGRRWASCPSLPRPSACPPRMPPISRPDPCPLHRQAAHRRAGAAWHRQFR